MTSKEPEEAAPWDDTDTHIESMLAFNDGDLFKVFKMLTDTICCDTRIRNNVSSPRSPSLKNAIENLETRTILSPEHVRILVYALLPRLKREDQMHLLESCGKMLRNRWWNAAQCSSIGMYQEIVRMLLQASLKGGHNVSRLSGIQQRPDLDRFKLWLNMVSMIGRHQCSVTDLRFYFKLLRIAVEEGKGAQLEASIRALANMASKDLSGGLSSYFMLSSSESCLRIRNAQLNSEDAASNEEEVFPSSAFTFMAWMRLDTSPNLTGVVANDIVSRMDARMSSRLVSLNRHSKRRGGYLYYFEGIDGGKSFCELCPAVGKDGTSCVRLVFTTCVPGSRDRVCEVPLGDADISAGQWTHVVVVAQQLIMWRSTITVYLNGKQRFQSRLRYPDAKSMRCFETRIGGFSGQLGPVCILDTALNRAEIRMLHSNPSRSISKNDVSVVNTIRYDPTLEYGLNGALHDVHSALDRAESRDSVREPWLSSWIDLPVLKRYRTNIRLALDARHCTLSSRKSQVAVSCRHDLPVVAQFQGNVLAVSRSSVGDAFASCGGVWCAVLPLLLSVYPPGKRLLPLKTSPILLRPISPEAFASTVHLLARVCRHSDANLSMMYENSGVRLLTCILKHCSSKMLTVELWWACNELIDAIRYGSAWCDAQGEATAVCRDLLTLNIWARASFDVQKEMWNFVLQGVMRDDNSPSDFRDRVLKSHSDQGDDRVMSKTFQNLLRGSIFYLRDLLSELQPWGVYGYLNTSNEKDNIEDTRGFLSSEEILQLRESLVNVTCHIIRVTYLQSSKDVTNDVKKSKERRKNISDLIRFVAALIDPSSSSSPSSSFSSDQKSKNKEETKTRGQQYQPADKSLFAPFTIIETLLSTSTSGIIHRVLGSIHDVGGLTIFWVALSSPVEKLRLMTLKLMRVYASAERKYGKEWRSRYRNYSPYREYPIDHGEALMIQRCLEPFELSVQTYTELREILLGRDAYAGSEPERFVIHKLALKGSPSGNSSLVMEDESKRFFDSKETERRCAELRKSLAVCPSMFLVIFELLPKAKTSLQMCAFRELAAMLTGNTKSCQENRTTIRSNVAWQRWFLYFIVVNSRKEMLTKTSVASRTNLPPPPPPRESIKLDTLLSKYDLSKDIRDMIFEASKSKDVNESVRILKNVVYNPETPVEVCVEAAQAIERHFRFSGDSSSGILAEVALSIFASVIGDWSSMEEAQVCLELLGPGWGLTQADAMGGWELRGLLRRVMFKAESLICGGIEDELKRKSSSRRSKKRNARRPSLNEYNAVTYDRLDRGNKMWKHLIILCEICTDVMLLGLLQHKGNDDDDESSLRHMKHSPEVAFGAKTYLSRLGGDGKTCLTKSGDRSTLAMLMDVWHLLSPQLRGVGDTGLPKLTEKEKPKSVFSSALGLFLSLEDSQHKSEQNETCRPSHKGGCLWRIAQLEIRALESSIERCIVEIEESSRKAVLISAETSLRRFNALCLRLTNKANQSKDTNMTIKTREGKEKDDERDKTPSSDSWDHSTVLSVWAVTRLDIMRQSILHRMSNKKDMDLRQIAEQLWSAQRSLLVFVRNKSSVSSAEKRLLRTVTDISVQKLLSTTSCPRKQDEKKKDKKKKNDDDDDKKKKKKKGDGVVSYIQTPLQASDSHFQPETNTSRSEAGAIHAAKSLQSFLNSRLVHNMKKQFGEYNSEYWSSLAKYLQERRTTMQMQMRRMHAENSLRRVRASQSSHENNTSSSSSSSSFSSLNKRKGLLHLGNMYVPKDESRVRRDRHDTAKNWRDVRDQLRDHAVSIQTSLWWNNEDNKDSSKTKQYEETQQYQIIDTFENSQTRARFRLKRNWDGHDYAYASYANSKREKSEKMVARATARAARCAMDAAAAATAEERAAFEAFCSICGDTKRKMERERETERREEIRAILERCVELVAREYEEEEEKKKKNDDDYDDSHVDMPSRAALELHLEEMLHVEEGEDIVYATEADLVFPMTVVRGTLELSERAITFHPERFSGPSCESSMLLEEKEDTEVFWIPDKARSSCARCGDPFRQIIGTGKHHCRSCGDIFCNKCSSRRLALPSLKYVEPVRVCDECFEKRSAAASTHAEGLIQNSKEDETNSSEDISMLRYHRWRLRNIRAVHRRRYLLQTTALELFLVDERSFLLHFFGYSEATKVLEKILSITGGTRQLVPHLSLARNSSQLLSQYELGSRSEQRASLLRFTNGSFGDWTRRWRHWEMSNFEYLMRLNTAAGRTYNDLSQYPIMPWILCDYESKKLNLNDPNVYRDLSKPVGALNPQRLQRLLRRMRGLGEGGNVPPFLYGSHYSSLGVPIYFLIRVEPYTSYAVHLQNGRFDSPGRLFHSVAEAWKNVLKNDSDVKELIPEFFCQPDGAFLRNTAHLPLGSRESDGQILNDVILPPWANNSPALFVRTMRRAIESEYVSKHIHNWIDLIFGHKQSGEEAKKANNLFYHLTYAENADMSGITDAVRKVAMEAQIANFGQTPPRLFQRPHPRRLPPPSELRAAVSNGRFPKRRVRRAVESKSSRYFRTSFSMQDIANVDERARGGGIAALLAMSSRNETFVLMENEKCHNELTLLRISMHAVMAPTLTSSILPLSSLKSAWSRATSRGVEMGIHRSTQWIVPVRIPDEDCLLIASHWSGEAVLISVMSGECVAFLPLIGRGGNHVTCIANDSETNFENSGGGGGGGENSSSGGSDEGNITQDMIQSGADSDGGGSGGAGDWIVIGTSSGTIFVWNAKRFARSEVATRNDLVRDAEKMLSRGILGSGLGRAPESYTSPSRRLWPELIINSHRNSVSTVSIRVDIGIVVSASSKQSDCLVHDLRTGTLLRRVVMSKPPNLLVSDAHASLNSASMRVTHVKIAADGSVLCYAICPENQTSSLLVCTVNGSHLAEKQFVGSFLHSIHILPNSKYIVVSCALYVKVLKLHNLDPVGTIIDLGLTSGKDRKVAIVQHTCLYSSPGSRIQSHWVMVAMSDGEINAYELGKELRYFY